MQLNLSPLRAGDVRRILDEAGYRPPGGVRQTTDEVWFWATDSTVNRLVNQVQEAWPGHAVAAEHIRPNRWTVAVARRPRRDNDAADSA